MYTAYPFNNIFPTSFSPSDPSQEQEFPEGSVAPVLEEVNDKAERGRKVSRGNVSDLGGVSCLCWETGWCDQDYAGC